MLDMVLYTCDPSNLEGRDRRIEQTLYEKQTKTKRGVGMAPVVEP